MSSETVMVAVVAPGSGDDAAGAGEPRVAAATTVAPSAPTAVPSAAAGLRRAMQTAATVTGCRSCVVVDGLADALALASRAAEDWLVVLDAADGDLTAGAIDHVVATAVAEGAALAAAAVLLPAAPGLPPRPVDRGTLRVLKAGADASVARSVEAAPLLVPPPPRPPAAQALPAEIGVLVMDFDGVFTDDRVLVLQDGTEGVLCHRGDGLGLEMLRKAGLELLVLSKEPNPVVRARADKVRAACLHGIDDKWPLLAAWLAERGLTPAQALFIGNDINDLDCLRNVGCGIAPAQAHPEALAAADIILFAEGGAGALRELADLILAADGHHRILRRPIAADAQPLSVGGGAA